MVICATRTRGVTTPAADGTPELGPGIRARDSHLYGTAASRFPDPVTAARTRGGRVDPLPVGQAVPESPEVPPRAGELLVLGFAGPGRDGQPRHEPGDGPCRPMAAGVGSCLGTLRPRAARATLVPSPPVDPKDGEAVPRESEGSRPEFPTEWRIPGQACKPELGRSIMPGARRSLEASSRRTCPRSSSSSG